MNTPLVSVLMPAYNAGPYVRQAAESILSQTYPHLELLVADDASTDNTRALLDALAGDPRVRLFHNETNRGYLQTTNELFRHCKGGLITFMDADDWSAPARIEKLVQAFERDPLLQCAGKSYRRIAGRRNEYAGIGAELPGAQGDGLEQLRGQCIPFFL